MWTKDDCYFRISDLVKKPRWNLHLTSLVKFGEVRRAQIAKSTLLTSTKVSLGSFHSDLLRSVQMLKRGVCGAESNGKLPHLFIPSKTATLVPEFAVEDLPLGRPAALVSEFAVKDLPFGQYTLMMMMMMII